ncbi:MAG: glycosyltransferase [Verrucomicrobiota bacterium]|jgi:glycosyltransferase involved in cell wall biosynthesis
MTGPVPSLVVSPPREKLRIFYLSYCSPTPTWGGAMAFYRHFIERPDFETMVATNVPNFPQELVSYRPFRYDSSRLRRRLLRTRLAPWLEGLQALGYLGNPIKDVLAAARSFAPDAVFTVAGSWDASALLAQELASRLRVPLVASFNDWFNFGWFPAHRFFHRAIERRFRRFYHEADVALCTSEGMREELGENPRAHILYPTGALMDLAAGGESEPWRPGHRPFTVGFAGSLSEWYGRMLERLISAVRRAGIPLDFRIFGSNASWSQAFDTEVKAEGIYLGHLPFEQLSEEMARVDALLLPMGFEEQAALVERTSFKTKFLDYLTYRKPIVVWGPGYCSAVRVAREFDSAAVCADEKEDSVIRMLTDLSARPERQRELVERAMRMYEDRFHPDRIHGGLVRVIAAAVAENRKNGHREGAVA